MEQNLSSVFKELDLLNEALEKYSAFEITWTSVKKELYNKGFCSEII